MRLSDYHYPYFILISKFLHYFEVDLEEELSEVVKSSHEVNNGSLSKMGFTKIGGKWVSKDGDQAGSSSGFHVANDEEELAAVAEDDGDDGRQVEQGNVHLDDAYDVGPSAGNKGEYITSISPF